MLHSFRALNKLRPILFRPQNYFCISNLHNIGISAHIDSGKTTFTERVLFYAGKISEIHEVKGTDNVGAKMDFMELEKEKGITIQSAATHCTWKDDFINIIDTPGHVDFTVEVERSLRVLDGAVLLLCGVAGVQPQTMTVFKQMNRYGVPRIIFINKLDRVGANPDTIPENLKSRLGLIAAAVQIPIGIDTTLQGIVDIINMKAYKFEGKQGTDLKEIEVPANLIEKAQSTRLKLVETLADVDEQIEEKFLMEEEPSIDEIKAAIRRQTIALKFSPIFMGSAYKNKGVQLALDGVLDYLPRPDEKQNYGFIEDAEGEEQKFELIPDNKKKFVGYAFKLTDNKFGQLTFVRVYQGKLKKGEYVYNVSAKKRMKISRMIKMHANEMQDIDVAESGEIFALFGIECNTGDTLVEGDMSFLARCSSMHVPEPVISLQIKPTKQEYSTKFNKALNRFQREDPTFQVNVDKESNEIIISGMGELHLQIYAERMRREFGIDVVTGNPTVNYRETISSKAKFEYTHKKQSGGAGQFAKVIGYIEPMPGVADGDYSNQFENGTVGTNIPNEFITAVEKGFYDSVEKGPYTGYNVVGVKYVLEDGQTHVVDSSSTAFMIATKYSFKQAFKNANPQILEPIMSLEITCPAADYQAVMAAVSKRRGMINNTESREECFVMEAEVPLSTMFGFATEMRGMTGGQGEFSMEYKSHEPVPPNEVDEIKEKFKKKKKADGDKDSL